MSGSDDEACDDEKRRFLGLGELWLPVFLPSFLLFVIQGINIPCVPVFANALGVGEALVGVAVAVQGAGKMTGNLPGGYLTQRIGVKRTWILGVALGAVASTIAALADTYPPLIAARLLLGFAIALWQNARHTFLSANVHASRRGQVFSTLGGIARVAFVVGPLLGGFVSQYAGIHAAFAIQVVLVLAAGCCVLCFLKVPHVDSSGGAAGSEELTDPSPRRQHNLWQSLHGKRRHVVTAVLFSFLLQLVRKSRELLIPLLATHMLLSDATIGMITSVGFATDSVMFFPSGVLSDRYGRKFAGAPAAGILGLAFVLAGTITSTKTTLALISALAGIGNGLSCGLVMTIGADLAPAKFRGQFLGWYRVLTDSGELLGPTITGSIAQTLSLSLASVCTGSVGVFASVWIALCVAHTREGGMLRTGTAFGSDKDGRGGGGIAMSAVVASRVAQLRRYSGRRYQSVVDEEEGEGVGGSAAVTTTELQSEMERLRSISAEIAQQQEVESAVL